MILVHINSLLDPLHVVNKDIYPLNTNRDVVRSVYTQDLPVNVILRLHINYNKKYYNSFIFVSVTEEYMVMVQASLPTD
jgi:hypothetical protein